MKDEYPDLYWHCYIKRDKNDKERDYSIVNDLTFEELNRTIVSPWHNGRPFTVSGSIITTSKDIIEIKISHTTQHQQYYASEHNSRMQAAGIGDIATNRKLLPFHKGKDYTFELLFENKSEVTTDDKLELVLRLCKRLKKSAQLICNRTRKGKISYTISDEYDVQDLLHALLRGFLKYSVTEDPISKVAGTKSARADISIEELGIIIEVKYIRSPSDQKKIFEQYSEDLVLYSKWEPLKTLIFMIYNSDDLSDGEALEKLSGEQTISGKDFDAIIVLA